MIVLILKDFHAVQNTSTLKQYKLCLIKFYVCNKNFNILDLDLKKSVRRKIYENMTSSFWKKGVRII